MRGAAARLRPEPAGATAAPPRRLFVRGDLRSHTGYAKAARALLAVWPAGWSVRGIDLHPDPHDHAARFAFPLLDDATLIAAAADAPPGSVVLHHTTPDDFRRIPGVANIGCFFWETPVLPSGRDWALKIAQMDRIWAPSRFIAGLAAAAGYTGPIDLIPWPHDFSPAHPAAAHPADISTLPVRLIDAAGSPQTGRFDTVRNGARLLFLAVQSLAARKGLPALLAGWRRFVARQPDATLLLRLAGRHSATATDAEAALTDALAYAGVRAGMRTRIALLAAPLDEAALAALYRHADALVSTTYGEGFGGTVAEALQHGCPVIAPRHTGLADLLAPDEPFTLPWREAAVGLIGNLPIYPAAARWHVVDAAALAARLAAFAALDPPARAHVLARARAHAAAFCGADLVRRRLAAILAAPARATAAAA